MFVQQANNQITDFDGVDTNSGAHLLAVDLSEPQPSLRLRHVMIDDVMCCCMTSFVDGWHHVRVACPPSKRVHLEVKTVKISIGYSDLWCRYDISL